MRTPEIVVFDVGNVLIDWDPRHLYRKVFDDTEEMEWFLREVCHAEWNLAQDAGRSWREAEAEAIARHPERADHIRTYRGRWHEMISGAIADTVVLLEDLARANVPLYAITNFAADTFAEIRAKYPFFGHFRGIVISSEIGIIKPDRRIYERLASDHGIDLARTVFIDDSLKNCEGARSCGMRAVQFANAAQARTELRAMGVIQV
jgi:2-haloacid dehalogenase